MTLRKIADNIILDRDMKIEEKGSGQSQSITLKEGLVEVHILYDKDYDPRLKITVGNCIKYDKSFYSTSETAIAREILETLERFDDLYFFDFDCLFNAVIGIIKNDYCEVLFENFCAHGLLEFIGQIGKVTINMSGGGSKCIHLCVLNPENTVDTTYYITGDFKDIEEDAQEIADIFFNIFNEIDEDYFLEEKEEESEEEEEFGMNLGVVGHDIIVARKSMKIESKGTEKNRVVTLKEGLVSIIISYDKDWSVLCKIMVSKKLIWENNFQHKSETKVTKGILEQINLIDPFCFTDFERIFQCVIKLVKSEYDVDPYDPISFFISNTEDGVDLRVDREGFVGRIISACGSNLITMSASSVSGEYHEMGSYTLRGEYDDILEEDIQNITDRFMSIFKLCSHKLFLDKLKQYETSKKEIENKEDTKGVESSIHSDSEEVYLDTSKDTDNIESNKDFFNSISNGASLAISNEAYGLLLDVAEKILGENISSKFIKSDGILSQILIGIILPSVIMFMCDIMDVPYKKGIKETCLLVIQARTFSAFTPILKRFEAPLKKFAAIN